MSSHFSPPQVIRKVCAAWICGGGPAACCAWVASGATPMPRARLTKIAARPILIDCLPEVGVRLRRSGGCNESAASRAPEANADLREAIYEDEIGRAHV